MAKPPLPLTFYTWLTKRLLLAASERKVTLFLSADTHSNTIALQIKEPVQNYSMPPPPPTLPQCAIAVNKNPVTTNILGLEFLSVFRCSLFCSISMHLAGSVIALKKSSRIAAHFTPLGIRSLSFDAAPNDRRWRHLRTTPRQMNFFSQKETKNWTKCSPIQMQHKIYFYCHIEILLSAFFHSYLSKFRLRWKNSKSNENSVQIYAF